MFKKLFVIIFGVSILLMNFTVGVAEEPTYIDEVYIATNHGIFIWSSETETIETFSTFPSYELEFSPSGELYVGNGGVEAVNNGIPTSGVFRIDSNGNPVLFSDLPAEDIEFEPDGSMIITNRFGVYRILPDGSQQQISTNPSTQFDFLSPTVIRTTNGAAYRTIFGQSTDLIDLTTGISTQIGNDGGEDIEILEDGTLMLSGQGGLFASKDGVQQTLISELAVFDFEVTPSGRIYFGNPSSYAVYSWRPGLYVLPSNGSGWTRLNTMNIHSIEVMTTIVYPNSAPVADANGPYYVDEGSSATLIGSGTDPDDDPLSFAWDLDIDGIFESPGQEVEFSAVGRDGPDLQVVALQVCDDIGACDTDTTEVSILNIPPTVNVGPDLTVFRFEDIVLEGSWSDPAGLFDEPYFWTWDLDGDGIYDTSGYANYGNGVTATISFDLEGIYTLRFSVTDDDGGYGEDTVTIEVLNRPPMCSTAAPSIDTLWPPNHEFVPIDILNVTDPEGDEFGLVIVSIFQDEAVNDGGDGDTAPDGRGIGSDTAEVRAERSGLGDGRVYHIAFLADDGHGGVCSGEVIVGVPKSAGKPDGPVDNGALFDSTIPESD